MKNWSRKFDNCQKCSTTDRPHLSSGLCKKCYQKKYRQSHKEERKEEKRRYRQSAKRKEGNKKYAQSTRGREFHRMCDRKRRAIKESLNFWESWMNDSWEGMLNQTKGYCPKCNKHVGTDKLTMDHIIPLSKGGLHRIDNVQPLCILCNCSKWDKIELNPKKEMLKKVHH